VSPRFRAFRSAAAAPLAIGVATALAVAWVWGSSAPIPILNDEASYLLQSQIFATGRWVAPGRPLPEFFEQLHVFVTPVLASKYPPGHAIFLALGTVVGRPALVPIAIGGVCGGLLFLLARKVADPATALLAWAVWISAPGVLAFFPSFLSETSSAALWLAGSWGLLEWWRGRKRSWLLLLGACVGWGALTRPLTHLALAVPAPPPSSRSLRRGDAPGAICSPRWLSAARSWR
jgi:hypothetical protein